jgi:hypothetical protein
MMNTSMNARRLLVVLSGQAASGIESLKAQV